MARVEGCISGCMTWKLSVDSTEMKKTSGVMKKKVSLFHRYLNVIYSRHRVKGLRRYLSVGLLERGEFRLRHPISLVGSRMLVCRRRIIRVDRHLGWNVVGNPTDFAVLYRHVPLGIYTDRKIDDRIN